jgi:hypothetical protein
MEIYKSAPKLDGAVPPTHLVSVSHPAPGAQRGRNVMLYIVSGVVVMGAGFAILWYFRPHNGAVHPLALKPVLEWLIPVGILTTLALGVGLIMGGVTG